METTLDEVIDSLDRWGIISLCQLNYNKRKRGIQKVKTSQAWGTMSYLINRLGMKKVLDAVEWDGDNVFISTHVVDNEKIVSDDWINGLMLRKGLMYATRPMLLPRITDDMSSYINDVHVQHQKEAAEYYIKDYV